MEEDQIREHLYKLGIHKSLGTDGMDPQVLSELGDIAKSVLVTFDRSW